MASKANNLTTAFEKSIRIIMERWNDSILRERFKAVAGCDIADGGITLSYFNDDCTVLLPEGKIVPESIPLWEQILILHYLCGDFSGAADNGAADNSLAGSDGGIKAGGNPDSSNGTEPARWISFKQLPNASFYNPTYRKRGPNIIIKRFAENPADLIRAGKKLGWRAAGYGDYSVTVRPFPRVESMVVFYAGDDEFPPDAEILYNQDIHSFLSLEDIAVLATLVSIRLVKSASIEEG